MSYFSALNSYHIDQRLCLKGFDDPRMALIIKGARRLFISTKRNWLPMIKDILEKIMDSEPLSVIVSNLDTAFKIAWAGL